MLHKQAQHFKFINFHFIVVIMAMLFENLMLKPKPAMRTPWFISTGIL